MGIRAFIKSGEYLPDFGPAETGYGARRIYRDIFGSDPAPAPPPPNYAPMAAASDHAAELGAELGREQLAESRRQYEGNRAVAQPVVDAQLSQMKQNQAQALDYYNYMVANQRPVEASLNAESMAPDLARQEAERNLATGSSSDLYNARRSDIDAQTGQAAGDVRTGQARNANMMVRQGLRYGYSPAKMAAMASQMATTNASQEAGAVNAARTQGIGQARADFTNRRSMGIQDMGQNWGRKMDVAGLYRNLPGASQGAYGLATNAGNSAVANQMQPGSALLTGMAQGAGMQQSGVGQQITGLGGVLNAQNSYNSMLAQSNAANAQSGGGGLGALIGAGATLGSAAMGNPAGWAGLMKFG